MTRAQDRAAAQAMGWTVVDLPFVPRTTNADAYFTDEAEGVWRATHPHGKAVKSLPRFSEDISAAQTLEAEIARRGLQEKYIEQLCLAIDGDTSSTGLMQRYWRDKMYPEHYWLLVTATAAQRAQAFVAVASGGEGG